MPRHAIVLLFLAPSALLLFGCGNPALDETIENPVFLHQWNLGHPDEGDSDLFQSAVQYITSQVESGVVDFFHVINFSPEFPTASLGPYDMVRECCYDNCSMILYNSSRWTKIAESKLCLTTNSTPATMARFQAAGNPPLDIVGAHLPFAPFGNTWNEAVSSLKDEIADFRKLQSSEDPIALLADTNVEFESNRRIFEQLGLREGAHTPTKQITCCHESLLTFSPDRIIVSFSEDFRRPVHRNEPTKWFKNMHHPILMSVPLPMLDMLLQA